MKYPYMTTRKGTRNYMYRRDLPPELRKFFGGKTALTKTLGTSDKQEAIVKYYEVAALFDEQIRKALQGQLTGTEFDTVIINLSSYAPIC